jgi:hypothetical protein
LLWVRSRYALHATVQKASWHGPSSCACGLCVWWGRAALAGAVSVMLLLLFGRQSSTPRLHVAYALAHASPLVTPHEHAPHLAFALEDHPSVHAGVAGAGGPGLAAGVTPVRLARHGSGALGRGLGAVPALEGGEVGGTVAWVITSNLVGAHIGALWGFGDGKRGKSWGGMSVFGRVGCLLGSDIPCKHTRSPWYIVTSPLPQHRHAGTCTLPFRCNKESAIRGRAHRAAPQSHWRVSGCRQCYSCTPPPASRILPADAHSHACLGIAYQ